MKINRMKYVLAVLLAAAMVFPTGTVTALAEGEEEVAQETPAEETDAASEEPAGETNVVEEEEEEFDSTPEEVREYLELLGEEDGYEVYLRPEGYKDAIEAKVIAEISDEDEAEDTIKDIEKHLKKVELALIDTETGKMAAELEEIGKSKTERIYFSEAGNYLVFLDKDSDKINRIRYRVSTLDSEFVFLTKDQKTLEYYSTDYEEIRAVMSLVSEEGGEAFYQSDDKLYSAVLADNKQQVLWCVKFACENDHFKMYYDEDTAMIGLENKVNGYIWWSSPIGCNRDTRATKLLVTDLQSSAVLTYGDSVTRGVTNLRSRNEAELSIKENADGITVTYDYGKCGVKLPIRYTLEEDYMSASVITADIQESKTEEGKVATQLTMLGSFGAAGSDENGYFVIPDGCGSLIRFNNGKETSRSYTAKVYGSDITMAPTTKPVVTEEIYMPVYGIVRDDGNAMAVVVEKGDGNVSLNASVSGQSLSSYNICSFNFMLRGSDTFYMSGDYGTITVFEDGPIKQDEICVRYYPIADEEVSYMDIAETYRNYLLEDGGVSRKAQADTTELYLDLYGGTMKNRSVMGVPIRMKTSMTSFSEAQEIVSGLTESGVDDMVVVYNNWTNEGISGKADNKAKPAGVLGGGSDFNRLTSYLSEQGIDFYPSVNNKTFKSGNGYYSFLDTTIRISNSYSRQASYNLSYGVQDASKKTLSLLSPSAFTELYGKLSGRYAKKGLTGVSLGEMTSTIWGDYGKQNMGRGDTIAALQESYGLIGDNGLSLLSDSCAAYAFAYSDRISDAPLQSSGFDVFDEDIPFYQLVLHGVIPYSGTAINASADSNNAFLTSIATGCNPAYDMIYAEASDLKDTELDTYYYSHYAFWSDTAAAEYQLADKVLSGVSDQLITDYVREGDKSVTTYENGETIEVDYAAETITAGGKTYALADLEKGE